MQGCPQINALTRVTTRIISDPLPSDLRGYRTAHFIELADKQWLSIGQHTFLGFFSILISTV